MCTQPIYVRIRHRQVPCPCGQCDECLSRKANDLYVRARYEFDDCLRNGGNGFMCCITYSNDVLPWFQAGSTRFMVFNKKDIIDFIKRLRVKLDRFYKKHFGCSAPDFKYLITCEYGTDPTKTHRPHYHLLFFFLKFMPWATFRKMFADCLCKFENGKLVKVFGERFQCDPLDPKRGGIKYCGKYVLKDLMYEPQRKAITEKIKFLTEYVNNQFSINSYPQNDEQEFRNKCIRSSKAYRKAISEYVLPYRHMLQFYMLSNDLGSSAIIRKYGKSLANMPSLNFEGFPFAIPKQIKRRFEESYGSAKSDELNRKVFANYVNKALNTLVDENKLSRPESDDLKLFAEKFVFPCSGEFYLINPSGFDFRSHLDSGAGVVDFDTLSSDFEFFYASNFYEMRFRLLSALSAYDSDEMRSFRASVAFEKRENNRKKYEQKKRNKPIKLY